MGISVGLFYGRIVSIVMAAGLSAAPIAAQDRAQQPRAATARMQQMPNKVLFDNEKVRVQEVTFKPGDQGPNIPRPFRVVRVLEGGTMQNTYSDGRIETVVYKTGEVIVREAEKMPYVPKNVGKSYIVFYVVALKDRR